MCELAVAEDLATRFRAYIANDDTDAVARLLTHDHVVLGLSDAGAHVDQLCDAPLPTDLLGTWVRDRGVMPLERAVRKLTGEPADMFGFARRGYLREGYAADVCVFDPATVGTGPTRRVRDFPADAERLTAEEPTGVCHGRTTLPPLRTRQRNAAGVTGMCVHGGGTVSGGTSCASTTTSTTPLTSSGESCFLPRKNSIDVIRGELGSLQGVSAPGRSGLR